LIGLTQELESILQRKVDVLTDEGLSPYLKERIQAEAVPL
jgi:predicted nucleotidyltransferase